MLVSQTANGQEISAGLEVAEDGPYACANDPQDSKNKYKDLSKNINYKWGVSLYFNLIH